MKKIFQLDENIIHLNHAAVGPWPLATRDAICAFAGENACIGSQRYTHWIKIESHLRQQLASLIHASSSDEIAILKNTSEGLSIIAQGLSWKSGDNIIIPATEFPSNRIVWQALATQGVETRLVDISDPLSAEQNLIDAMDRRTRVLSCSSVQYASGLRLNLQHLGEVCNQRNIFFCIDAIQSLGAITFDVDAIAADAVVADGHKWLCAPEGTALFYCRRKIMDQLQLSQYGWHMVRKPLDFEQTHWQPADNSQRFECGSPNMTGIVALNSSLNILFEVGLENIERQVLANSQYLFEVFNTMNNIEVLTSQLTDRYAGIVTFRCKGVDNNHLYQYLQEQGVICALRGGGIRFSPHFYTDRLDIARAIEYISNFKDT